VGRRRLIGTVGRTATLVSEELGQGQAVDELHGVVVNAALAADRVDRHDVLVVQARRRPCLVMKALQMPRVHRRRERQHLQGHPPAQRELFRFIDNAHAAAADFVEDAEVAQRRRHGPIVGHRRGHRRLARPRETAQVGHHTDGGQELTQPVGVLGMGLGIRLHIDGLSRLHPIADLVEQVHQDRVGAAVPADAA
jgi:hypothetical protein